MEAELRQELARLQEREAELTRLLQLERERRVRAEQDSEIEKQACLELGQLLSREKQLRPTCPTSPSQMTLVPGSLREEEEEMVEEENVGANLYPAFSSHTTTESKVSSVVAAMFSLPLSLVLVSKYSCDVNNHLVYTLTPLAAQIPLLYQSFFNSLLPWVCLCLRSFKMPMP